MARLRAGQREAALIALDTYLARAPQAADRWLIEREATRLRTPTA